VALILMGLFALVVPRRSPRPLPLAVMSVIAVVWLFGATLIWGTGYPSKVRWGIELNAWQGAALLAVAAVGVLSGAAALRSFAHSERRAGWALASVFVIAFLGWSSVVRYSVIIVFIAVGTGIAAMWFASTPPAPSPAARPERPATQHANRGASRPWLWNSLSALVPFLAGPLFYWWLRASPKSWIDPTCGLASWLPLTFIPFIAIPGFSAWIRSRALGKSREAAAAAVVAAAAVTIGGCLLAFLVWFGANKCGE
jgi:hypothetical protein